MAEPTVIVSGSGRVEAGDVTENTAERAHCAHCGDDVAVAVLLAGVCVCVDCLRAGLDASSVARYRLAGPSGIPWGKVTS